MIQASTREDIGKLLKFSTRQISFHELQHMRTETLQMISEIYRSLVQTLNADATDNDDATDVEEFIRWYCLKHIMENIKAL